MGNKLSVIEEAYQILKNYSGNNGYIIQIKNGVLAYKNIKLNEFQANFIIENKDFNPTYIGKIVKVSQAFGEMKKREYNLDFVPKVVEIGYYMGKTKDNYVFYLRYRKSQEKGILTICSIDSILTDFLSNDYHDLQIDFDKYDKIAHEKDINRTINESQKEGIKFLLSRKKCILADEQGFGKMEPVDSLIPTIEGFKRMGDIHQGDIVFNKNGKPTKVLETYYHQNKPIYKVTFSDKTTCECGMEHLWYVHDSNDKKIEWKTMSLKDILLSGLKLDDEVSYRYQIPVSQPVEYNTNDAIKRTMSDCYSVGATIANNILMSSKTKYSSKNKIDISNFKNSSIKQRIELLNGLMDINGKVDKENNVVTFTSKDWKLSLSIKELVYSLGGIATIVENKNYEYVVSIIIPFNPFTIQWKSNLYKECHDSSKLKKYIVNVEFSRNSDAQCILVDCDDHTYLTGKNYIVTHNTLQLTVAAIEGGFESVIIICPASIKTNWKNELSYYVPEKDITIVESYLQKSKPELETMLGYEIGTSNLSREELLKKAKIQGKWSDNKFVIVNYDIVDEFYSISSRKKKIDEEVLRNNPMLRYIKDKKSLIIVDEAHKLSKKDSIRYNVIHNLIKRGNPDSVYLATGTPVTNNPENLFYILQLLNHPITKDWNGYMKKYCNAKKFVHPSDKDKRDKIQEVFLRARNKTSWHELTGKEKDDLRECIERKCKMITVPQEATNLDELKERVSTIYLRRVKEDLTGIVRKYIHEEFYELTSEEKGVYDDLWNQYEQAKKEENPDKDLNKDLLEGAIYRKYISNIMVTNTEKLVDKLIVQGEKVVIACCYDEELYSLKEYYGDSCVIYNGKMNSKQKDAAITSFYNDSSIKVFIGNIIAAGVGINLVNARYMVFNNMSYVYADNQQMEDRIFRITQKKDCHIYYQIFKDTQYEHMWETVLKKKTISDAIIKKESEK
jgi:hypothetical protein